jgi:uncharacterized protein
MIFLDHLVDITLDMAPWLLGGILAAGLIKAWIPESLVTRWLGGHGAGSIIRGALVGAPLPLCSCSVIPMAIGLRRNGASKSSTVSFLVATPETGVDSIALSWIMLGPFMTVARPVCAIISAVYSGFLTLIAERADAKAELLQSAVPAPEEKSSCASSSCGCPSKSKAATKPGFFANAWDGIHYSLTSLWDDIAPWLAGGIILTAMVHTWVPEGELQSLTSNSWLVMFMVVALSIPVYVCATASTPMAAAMLYSGISPGVVLAFLIAGPGTNLAPLAIIKKEMGWRTMIAYLTGILTSAIALGLSADWIIQRWNIELLATLEAAPVDTVPVWLAVASTLILVGYSMRSLLSYLKSRFSSVGTPLTT